MKKQLIYLSITLLAGLILSPIAAQSDPQPTGITPWDLLPQPQDGVFIFYDSPMQSSTTGKPVNVGDLNDDGCGDMAITGHNASHTVNGTWRNGNGHVRLFFDLCDLGEGYIALEEADPFIGSQDTYRFITIYGAYAGDMLGTETTIADFNADGFDDLLVSAQNTDGVNFDRVNAGSAYVIFGSADMAQGEDIDLRDPPSNVLAIHGADASDHFAVWVEHGDFDGDGITDLLLGANQADGIDNARINAGETWIIYGDENMIGRYGAVIDMRQPPRNATQIIGVDYDDLFGSTVVGGDLNGDGIDDAVISAALWRGSAGLGGLSFGGGDGPDNRRYNAGETFVVYGGPSLPGQVLEMSTLIDEEGRPVDERVTSLYGAGVNDLNGEEIAIGDLNGDGLNDLALGTLVGYGPGDVLPESGEAWIVYNTGRLPGKMIDFAQPPATTVVIYPDQPSSKGGDTMLIADLDKDGYGDLLYASPDYDPTGYAGDLRRNAGTLTILYGEADPWPSINGELRIPYDVPDDLRLTTVIGADANDMLAYSMTVYDLDGDGWLDIIPNQMGGDGLRNTLPNAGEIVVIDGIEFNSTDHTLVQGETGGEPAAPIVAMPTLLPLTIDISVPGDADVGDQLFAGSCAGCHGAAADGAGVGPSLLGNAFIAEMTDAEFLDFLRRGRSSDDPLNESGINMPAYSGREEWGDAEMWDIVAYVRGLNEAE